MFSKETLKKLIAQVTQLGFLDDVEHWKSELAKLENKTT